MRIRYSRFLPLRFYFESEEDRNKAFALFGRIGEDGAGPFIEVIDSFGEILLRRLQEHNGTLRLLVDGHRISLRPRGGKK